MSHAPQFSSPAPEDSGDDTLAGRKIAVLRSGEASGDSSHASAARAYVAGSLVELIENVAKTDRPLILIDPASIGEHDIELAGRLKDLPCRPTVTVIGGPQNMGQAVMVARRLNLSTVLPEDCLDFSGELATWISWIEAGGPPVGLAHHLGSGAAIEAIVIREKEDKGSAIDRTLDFIGSARPGDSFGFDIRLILEETLNNAIYHAFQSEGEEKYSVETFKGLATDEQVVLSVGADDRAIGLAVRDNQGALEVDTILGKLERHLNIEGLLDESGRGLYLTYSLAGRLIINLAPGCSTELVMLFPLDETPWPGCSPTHPVLVFNG